MIISIFLRDLGGELPRTYVVRPMEHFLFNRCFLRAPLQPMLISRPYESLEQRMRLQRLRLELRMKLTTNIMRVVRKLDHLHISPVRRRPRNSQSASRQRFFILAVEFITMPMPLADLKLAVNPVRQSSRLDLASPRAQPHGPTQFLHPTQFAQLVNHAMRSRRIELARIRIRQAAYVACKLDARRLHP